MAFKPIKMNGHALHVQKCIVTPDFGTRTILVDDKWDYVEMWLKRAGVRKRNAQALLFWRQALEPYLNRPNVHDQKSLLHDMSDTAAVISKLDLVITIDTSVAHLAGALGAPVWLLLPFSASWRWLKRDRKSPWFSKTPWYPTMRLFRSTRFNAWSAVVGDVKAALLKLLNQSPRHRREPLVNHPALVV